MTSDWFEIADIQKFKHKNISTYLANFYNLLQFHHKDNKADSYFLYGNLATLLDLKEILLGLPGIAMYPMENVSIHKLSRLI